MGTNVLWPYEEVTLNIGLGRGEHFDRLTVPGRIKVFRQMLPTLLERGYIAHIAGLVPTHVYSGEPTMIVQGRVSWPASVSMLPVYKLTLALERAGQDCAAVFNHATNRGALIGPKAELCGAFDINRFHFLGEKYD